MNQITLVVLVLFSLKGMVNYEVFRMGRVPSMENGITTGVKDTEQNTRGLVECAILCQQSEHCETIRYNSTKSLCTVIRNVTTTDFSYKGDELGEVFRFNANSAPSHCTVDDYVYVWELNFCMQIYFDKLSWFDAKSRCEDDGGHLIVMDYPLKDIILGAYYEPLEKAGWEQYQWWMGLSDIEEEGKFIWVTGLPLQTFNKWSNGQPDNKSNIYPNIPANCVNMRYAGKTLKWMWLDRFCTGQLRYFCEKVGYV